MKHRRISNLHRGLCLAGLPVRNTFASAADPLAMRYYEDAVARVNKGDTRSAPVQLRNSLQRDPTRLSAKILPGRIYLAFGQPLEAEQTLLQAQRLGADPYLTAVSLAKARNRLGKYAQNIMDVVPTAFAVSQQPLLWVQPMPTPTAWPASCSAGATTKTAT